MIDRRAVIAGGAALACPAAAQDMRSLRALAAAKGFVFGSAAATYEFKDADFPPVLLRDCDPGTRATIASAMLALRPIFRSEDPRLATSDAKPDRAPRPKKIRTTAS